ncbi:uncharacterized protein BT62DRAFT_917500 [Guyanagaster necrorhizus]|uniref:Uncharacterized protein n=1 Tax=Guyanagaster necrorhizus TaxID=856835 RepID=A0A9P8AXH5_9AGAR|nr:uncharacterized protein BT62DRAFT_917500 [Guyanagaster necrorhizus MCA 3950]KAG7449947.1 hypothetical protein BT62DRAFT_917500 [Guyanagaster necrorhizus MCA 3950]
MGVPDFTYYKEHFEPLVAQSTPEFLSSSLPDPPSDETVDKRTFANLNTDPYLVLEIVSEDEVEVNNEIRRIVGSKRVARHHRSEHPHKTLPLPSTPAFSFKCTASMTQTPDADGKEVRAMPPQLPVDACNMKCDSQPDTTTLSLASPYQSDQPHLRLDVDMIDINC